MSIFGAKVAFAYVIVGLIIAVIGGTFIENLHMEKYVEDFVKNASRVDISSPDVYKRQVCRYAAGNRRRSFDSISVASGRRCGDRDISTGSCTDDREKSGEYGGTDEYSGTWDHRKLQLCKMP